MSYGQWKVDEIATMNEFGYNTSELKKNSHKPVKCKCESCGMIANKRFRESNAKHICKSIIDGKKKCFNCKTFKVIEEFSKNKWTFDGYQKLCKECFSNYSSVKKGYKKKSFLLKNDFEFYLKNKISFLNRKSIKKNIPFNIDKDFIYELFLKQEGKCYYTKIPIVHNVGCHQYDSISIDRLNPNGGYTKDNVVLASFNINSLKGMMNENEFKTFLQKILPELQKYINT